MQAVISREEWEEYLELKTLKAKFDEEVKKKILENLESLASVFSNHFSNSFFSAQDAHNAVRQIIGHILTNSKKGGNLCRESKTAV